MSCIRVLIDRTLCEGHALCTHAAPEVFALDADEKSTLLMDEVPASLEEQVREAAAICPEAAIQVEDGS
jgi:ferredoxin